MKSIGALAVVTVALTTAPAWAQQAAATLDAPTAGRFAALTLACVHKEYPNKITHILNSPDDVRAPRELTPAFYGCFDWHSSVHGHWLLARLVREFPKAAFVTDAVAALKANLTPAHIAGEVGYLNGTGRESFERPYGLAWLLQLAAELRESETPDAAALSSALKPLEEAVVAQLKAWLPKLAYPIREGEHAQTAFAFGLILDYARGVDAGLAAMVVAKVREFHLNDRDCPITYEPSGQDFLSPCVAEADVMRRILPPAEFAAWLTTFLPRLPTTGSGAWLPIGVVTDKTDGKLAHLDGLNLSRAWMLEGIAAGLPSGGSAQASTDGRGPDPRRQRTRCRDRRALRRRSLARQLRHLPHDAPRYREQALTCRDGYPLADSPRHARTIANGGEGRCLRSRRHAAGPPSQFRTIRPESMGTVCPVPSHPGPGTVRSGRGQV